MIDKINGYYCCNVRGHDLAVNVTSYSAGDPGCRTMANGDPGWPPEPGELEYDVYVPNSKWTRFKKIKNVDIEDHEYEAIIDDISDVY